MVFEQRRHFRLLENLVVIVQPKSNAAGSEAPEEEAWRVFDISEGGILAHASAPLPAESEVELNLILDHAVAGESHVYVEGKVIRSYPLETQDGFGVAIEFTYLEGRSSEQIADFIARRKPRGP